MGKIRSLSRFVCLTLLIVLLGMGSPAGGIAAEDPIVIGLVHTLSGPIGMYGKSCDIAGQIAVEEINQKGGVLGRPFKMISRDDKLNPEVGLREAKSLVIDEKAAFLTGTISSAVSLALSEYSRANKMLYFITNAQSSRITEEMGHRYLFRINTNSFPYHGVPATLAAKKWKGKKICVTGPDYEWGKVAARDFFEIYKKSVPDAEIVREVWVPLGTNDYTPYISSMMSSGADILQHSFYGGMDLAFTKQATMMGLFKKMHVSASCSGDAETWYKVKKGQPYPEGAVATCRYPYWAFENPRNKEFARKFAEKTDIAPNYGAVYQYITIHALADVIAEVGSLDTEKIITALEDRMIETPFDAPLISVKIRACDHQAMMPNWVGLMGYGQEVSFPHLIQMQVADNPETTYRSCEEIAKMREQASKEGARTWKD